MRGGENMNIPVSILDTLTDEVMVCVFCDRQVMDPFCGYCQEYKGLMTITEWESYTGEVWED
jgi:hypothetical protein